MPRASSTAAAFAEIQDKAIRDVVRLQEEAGLQVVTDGEFRRSSYWGRFVERCSGFEIKPAVFKFRDDHGHEVDFTATYAAAKLARTQPLAADEFAFLRSVAKVDAEDHHAGALHHALLPLHGFRRPQGLCRRGDLLCRPCRTSTAQEIADLAKAGCRYIQLDEVAVAMLCDPAIRDKISGAGQDPDRLVDLYIKAINDCVAGAPADMVDRHAHVPRQFPRPLPLRGRLRVGRRALLHQHQRHALPARVRHARAGDFKPLRFVPKGKGVVLGLVSTKTPVLETDRRSASAAPSEAAKFIDLDRLGIGPQCGFASTAAGNPLTEADERAKLRLLVDAARAIWG